MGRSNGAQERRGRRNNPRASAEACRSRVNGSATKQRDRARVCTKRARKTAVWPWRAPAARRQSRRPRKNGAKSRGCKTRPTKSVARGGRSGEITEAGAQRKIKRCFDSEKGDGPAEEGLHTKYALFKSGQRNLLREIYRSTRPAGSWNRIGLFS
jgi:hypothetical protein